MIYYGRGERSMILEFSNVKKSYKKIIAVEDINIHLKEGIYGLLGENGAGKTTLLNMLAANIMPTEGYITFNGKNINFIGKEYRKLLGYLPQNFGFYPELTGQEYLEYLGLLKGIDSKYLKKQVKFLLKKVGLQRYATRKLGKYSGGMVRRIGIAQAFLNDPRILILDEPTVGLDPAERLRMKEIIREMGGNKIIILSTHIVSDVEDLSDIVILLNNGKVFRQGSIEECTSQLRTKVWSINKIDNSGYEIFKRVISDKKPDNSAVLVKPKLEDVFMVMKESEKNGFV